MQETKSRTGGLWAMGAKQWAAVLVAPVIVLSMLLVYFELKNVLPREWAWFTGFLVYWSFWCLAFPLWLLGPERVLTMFRRPRWHRGAALLATAPVLVAAIGHVAPHGETPSALPLALLVFSTVVMGVLEEVLWRGLYLALFPGNWLWGVVWPSLFFALWHFAPGMVSPLDARVLVAGAAIFGLLLGWIAQRTGSIRWTATAHVVAGLVRML